MLAASAGVSAIAVLAWLVAGSDALLVTGLTGIWQLLRRFDRAASHLREETAEPCAMPPQST